MNKNATIITVILAALLGIILGLAKSEDKRYSYKA